MNSFEMICCLFIKTYFLCRIKINPGKIHQGDTSIKTSGSYQNPVSYSFGIGPHWVINLTFSM